MSIPMATVIGLPEWLVIFGIILLLFGATKIPQVMRGLGQGINEFKKGMKEGTGDDKDRSQLPPSGPPK